MKTITATLGAYLPINVYGPKDLNGPPDRVINCLSFFNYTPRSNYVPIGQAHITVELTADREAMNRSAIASLREAQEEIKAEAQRRITVIDEQINNLLAITYEEPSCAAT